MWVLPPKKLRGAQNNRNLFLWTTTNRIFCHFGQKNICSYLHIVAFKKFRFVRYVWPAGWFQSHSSTCHESQIRTRTNKRRFLLHFIFFTNLDVLDLISRNYMTLSLKAWSLNGMFSDWANNTYSIGGSPWHYATPISNWILWNSRYFILQT